MEKPNIYILDEPMNGLDNEGVEDMRGILKELRKEGKTILLVSHNNEDIQTLCDEIYDINHGKVSKRDKVEN